VSGVSSMRLELNVTFQNSNDTGIIPLLTFLNFNLKPSKREVINKDFKGKNDDKENISNFFLNFF